METSPYFERTLFHDRSPAADEYYARSADTIFEKDPRRSKVEVRVQSSLDVSYYDRKRDIGALPDLEKATDAKAAGTDFDRFEAAQSKLNFSQIALDGPSQHIKAFYTTHEQEHALESDGAYSLSSRASSTALSVALDQTRGSLPPTYPGPPTLTSIDLNTATIRSFVKRTQQCFRVFYLRQRHSNSRLQITQDLFEQLLEDCHVFPRFNEYVIGFGLKSSESEVGPPPLKFRSLCESRGNSCHGFECSYILRYVEFTNRPGGKQPWSLRQFAVYHRYKPNSVTRCSTWILVGASQRTEVRLDRYTRSIEDLMGSNPFELHVMFLDTAITSWRPYLVDLNTLVSHQSKKAVGISVGIEDDKDDLISIEVEDHQDLKQIEDQLADLVLCLDSTLDTVSTFEEMYEQFRIHQTPTNMTIGTKQNLAYRSDAVVFALKEKTKEVAYTRKKANALLSKVQNTRTLISSLLERRSGHNLDQQMFALQKLEKQGQDENAIMRKIAEKNSRDSSSMRILTIITMIYLPCTIVSNFYSTQFVNRKELPSGDTQLEYAKNTYIFFAISVPLTLCTISIWYVWVNLDKIASLVRRGGYENREGSERRKYGLTKPRVELPR